MCARRRSNFLLRRQEKVTKEKATPSLRPPFALSGERGQPAMLESGVGVAELAPFPLRVNSAQTAATSQTTKRVCPSAHTPTPAPALLGAASRGGERGHGRLLLRSCAGCRIALRAADGRRSRHGEPSAAKDHRPSEAMARMEPVPTPF